MRQRKFRNKVAESSLTLPFMVVVTLVSCFLQHGFRSPSLWLTLLFVGAITYGMVEWNNQCQLLRIRSRMVSSSFLAFVAAFPMLQVSSWVWLPALCLLLSYFAAFKGYGRLKPQGWVFHSFLSVGVGSLFFPPMLLLVPFMFFAFSHQLRILSGKSAVASVLGLLFPFWTLGLFCYVSGWNMVYLRRIWEYSLDFRLPDYGAVQPWQWVFFAMLALLGAIGIQHFVRTSYNDKIRTRQYYYTLLALHFPILFLVVWFPDAASFTLPLLLLNTVPFVAHFYVFARGRSMNFWFVFSLSVLLAVAVFAAFDLFPSVLPTLRSWQRSLTAIDWQHLF